MHLANERGRLKIQDRDVGVGRLAAIMVAEPAADAHGARGRPILSQCPAAHVDDVDPVIPDLAVARVPEPVPLVVQLLAHQWPIVRRAAPKVVIHGAPRRRGRFDQPDAVARAVDQRMREADGPEFAPPQAVEHLAEERGADRFWVPTWTMRPYLLAAATICCPSHRSYENGFST